jgi:hypothetical protein
MAAASLLLKSSWLLPHHLYQNIFHMLVFDKNLSLSRQFKPDLTRPLSKACANMVSATKNSVKRRKNQVFLSQQTIIERL